MHYFKDNINQIPLPEQFTYPFYYSPHPLCIMAAQEMQIYLQSRTDWHEELQKGKMFGVLIVRNAQGEIGFLTAFSGNLAGSNYHDYFVPPVYDLLNPAGYFKEEEERISDINRNIQALEQSSEYLQCYQYLKSLQKNQEQNLKDFRKLMGNFKKLRSFIRKDEGLSGKALEAMTKESQYLHAEEKRREQFWQSLIDKQEELFDAYQRQLSEWKKERKQRSAALQRWIFQQFQMRNARGEAKDLCEIFADTPQGIPPAGSGECAAPKLLQYAYLHGLYPLAMAECWWGDSPKGEIRRHGYFYPACKHKCEPILGFMLQGLNVESNPLLSANTDATQLPVLFEDEYLLIVNKPAGMLSVPGKTGQASVYSLIAEKYPDATGPLVVHRLDMDTSGLLLIAKTKEIHSCLQEQFEKQEVKKRYIAQLSGKPSVAPTGFIRLPLRPDYENRPLQVVDHTHGKPSVTRYEILESMSQTLVAFYPQTGRTHQLRVHAAHQDGLNCPILGDPLYGQPSDRLYLHAESLEFKHPVTGKYVRISSPCPFK